MKFINQRTFLILILTTVGCWALAGVLFKIDPVKKSDIAKAFQAELNKKGRFSFSFSDSDSRHDLQEHAESLDIPPNEVESIEVYVTNSNVYVEGSEEVNLKAKYKVQVESGEKPMTYSLENKVLKIEIDDEDIDESTFIRWNDNEVAIHESNGDLKLKIPQNLKLKKLEIKSINGQVKASDLAAELLDIANVNGDIKISKVITKTLDVAQVAGQIRLENSQLIHGEIAAVDGDIKIQLADRNDFFVQTTTISGEVKNQQGSTKGTARGQLEVTSVAGNIKVSVKKN